MKVKFGAIVVDGRNKIGGHVMSKNRAGAYMRTKVTPVNPRSPDQQNARARLSMLSSSWDGLTYDDILAWNSAIKNWAKSDIFGDIKHPSGFNLFQKLNNNLTRVGGTQIDVPPVKVPQDDLGTLVIGTVTASAIPLTFTLQSLGGDDKLEILATPPVSLGKSFVKSEYRIIGHSLTLTTGACDAGTLYIAKFGGPIDPGKPFFIMARLVNSVTGQSTIPISAKYNP
jgi:hypothetical protein